MPMSHFIRPADRHALVWHLGSLLLLLGLLLVVPLLVAVLTGDVERSAAFAGTGAASALVGGLIRRRDDEPDLRVREALLVVALAYLLLAVVGAVAFLGVLPPVDALFESMSGFTTTGLTLLDVGTAPDSLLFFRAYSQWLGGAGIIVISLVVLSGAGGAASRLFSTEFGQENLLGSVVATARLVGIIYGALTALGYVALLLAGAGAFDGLLHALSLSSTGGFSPFADSIADYDSTTINVVVAAGMVLGAVSIPLYHTLGRRGLRAASADAQVRALLLLGALGFLGILASTGFNEPGVAAFTALSALSTTGFGLVDSGDLPAQGRLVTVLLMVVGGSLGSTAGGIKIVRLLLLIGLLRWALQRSLLPRRATVPLRAGGEAVDRTALLAGLALVVGYAVVAVTATLALSATGAPVGDVAFEAVSALSTVGLSSGFTSPELPAWAKLVLTAAMWTGRVEVLPVLLLFHPRNYGRTKRRGT